MSATTFYSATGKVPYQLTNDYLFQAVLQSSNETLKGLVCSLLHINPEKVHSVVITNPIELGEKIDRKKFILDVRVLLDNQLCLNIELQVVNQGNWPERSIVYLCRSFDQLNKGQDYIEMKPVVQICILDFTLFPDNPEFYATQFTSRHSQSRATRFPSLRDSLCSYNGAPFVHRQGSRYSYKHESASLPVYE